MNDKIYQIAQNSESLEEIIKEVHLYCKEKLEDYQTLSILVDRGLPTFIFTINNRDVLVNLTIPWKSVAGECMKSDKTLIEYAPESKLNYRKPMELTGLQVEFIHAIPLKFLGQTFGCLEILTEKKHEIENNALFEEVANFLAPIVYLKEWHSMERRKAHAIKNKAFLGALTLACPNVEEEKKLEILNDSFDQISHLSEDFIKLTEMKFDLAKGDVVSILKQAIIKLENLAELNDQKVDIVTDFVPEAFANLDAHAFREEVFFNIIKNVWEEWEKNDADVRNIEIKVSKKEGQVVVQMTDNAGGIPADIAKNLFMGCESSKGVGRGVGMNVAYQIVKIHKGEMMFTTEEGVGTTFTISLPVFQG